MPSESKTNFDTSQEAIPSGIAPLEPVCASVLLCVKSLGLYPPDHPRVKTSLEDIRGTLDAYSKETGHDVRFETEVALEEPDSRADPVTRRDRYVLARLLQLHLIAEIALTRSVTPNERFEFCFLLLEDFFKKATDDEEIHVDPRAWQGIDLIFYKPEDLPENLAGGANLLERAAGLQHIRQVSPVLSDLPAGVQQGIRSRLSDPKILRRVVHMRDTLQKRFPTLQESTHDGMDVFEEAFRAAVSSQPSGPPPDEDSILRRLGEFLDFTERHLEVLGNTMGESSTAALETRPSETTPGLGIRETQGKALKAGVDAVQVHQMKDRLGAFFRTAYEETEGNTEPTTDASNTPVRHNDPEEVPDTIRFPLGVPAIEVTGVRNDLAHLQVCLELLTCDERRPRILPNWERISKDLVDLGGNEACVKQAVEEISAALTENPSEEIEELLYQTLFRARKSAGLLSLLEDVVQPRVGTEFVAGFMSRFGKRGPRKAIALFSFFDREGQETVQRIADIQLTQMARDPALLAAWAAEDPTCFNRPRVLENLQGIRPEKVRQTFRAFFASITQEQAASFLARLPAGLTGLEQILFTAMDHGAPLVRQLAMRQLCRYPTPKVTRTLIEVVKLNNLREIPQLAEVRAAIAALAEIHSEMSETFLAEIQRRRWWFFPNFKKSIRETLVKIQSGPDVDQGVGKPGEGTTADEAIAEKHHVLNRH